MVVASAELKEARLTVAEKDTNAMSAARAEGSSDTGAGVPSDLKNPRQVMLETLKNASKIKLKIRLASSEAPAVELTGMLEA